MEYDLVNKLIETNMELSKKVGSLEKENEYLREELENLDPKTRNKKLLEIRKQLDK